MEAYIRKQLRAGAAAYLAVVVRPRKWRRFYAKGSKTGQPMLLYTGGAADEHGPGAEAREQLRGDPPSSVLIRGGEMAARTDGGFVMQFCLQLVMRTFAGS